jgi:uncharacterized membrane protein YecN with MAPEG domain
MITGLYAALCALLILTLSLRIVRLRTRHKIGLGDGGVAELGCAIRAQANAVEYVPILMIMLLIIENNGASALAVHAYGATLLLARLLHAFGLSSSSGRSFGRFWGTALTWGVLLVSAFHLLWLFASAQQAMG